jgi:predicted nucleic acid-binding protein
VLDSRKWDYGTTPAYTGETPAKATDTQYTYTFAGWNKAVAAVTGNATYTATYTSTIRQYTVTFKDEDGSVLDSRKWNFGTTPAYTGETPTKAADTQYTYSFAGWTPKIGSVTGNAVYTATYTATPNQYTVTFKDEDGSVLDSRKWDYGTIPAYTGGTPAKAADAHYTYTFAGWDKAVVAVTGDATYTATYSSTVRQYTVTFKDEDGSVLDSREWNYGTTPSCTEPTKASDAQYTYTFAGWDKEVVAVTGAATYIATYTTALNQYTVVFKDEDGSVLDSREWNYGTTPSCTEPTKSADAQYTYTFAGWTPEVVAVTGAATYIATYTGQLMTEFNLVDNKTEGDEWYTTLASLAGHTMNVRYIRTMPANEKMVFSLPFDFNLLINSNHPFNGHVYALETVTNEEDYLNLYFLPVTVMMKANTPYVFYSGTEVVNPVFENVTVTDLEENPYSAAIPTGGTVSFVNTTAMMQLHQNDPLQFYIANDRLYQSGNSTVWMRAFRGYFMLNEIPAGVRPRVRIVLKGQTATAIELLESDCEQEVTPAVRKYVRNGILVIENNGVHYNAQGARMSMK